MGLLRGGYPGGKIHDVVLEGVEIRSDMGRRDDRLLPLRNYRDVTTTIREFMHRGVIIRTVINNMTFDGSTKDPMQQAVRDARIAFMAATAQAQAEAAKEAQRAGIEHALANDAEAKYRGRKPTFTWDRFVAVQQLLSQGIPVGEIAKTIGLKRQTIYRIQSEPEPQLAALAAWYPIQAART